MSEMPIRSEDIADPEFHHDGHSRKIRERYIWFVRELFPQFDCPVESGLGNFLDVNKWRLHDGSGKMPGVLKWPALEQVRKCLIQDKI